MVIVYETQWMKVISLIQRVHKVGGYCI